MSEYTTYLISLLTPEGTLLRCALRTKDGKEEFYMEPDARERLRSRLPLHVQSIGPIVHVEEIFDLKDEK